jgi:hypothetical protein
MSQFNVHDYGVRFLTEAENSLCSSASTPALGSLSFLSNAYQETLVSLVRSPFCLLPRLETHVEPNFNTLINLRGMELNYA